MLEAELYSTCVAWQNLLILLLSSLLDHRLSFRQRRAAINLQQPKITDTVSCSIATA
jgi:hypothetical protein